jgi:hypothetical protein
MNVSVGRFSLWISPCATGFWTIHTPGLLDAPAWTMEACPVCLVLGTTVRAGDRELQMCHVGDMQYERHEG